MWNDDDDDDDDAPQSVRTCVDCHIHAPKTDTNYTLISAKHGWRLTRLTDSNGGFAAEWRCPQCWERHKAAKIASGGAPPSSSRGAPPSSSRGPLSPRVVMPPASAPSEPQPTPQPPPSRRGR